MNRTEFCALPLPIMLGILYDGSPKIRELAEATEAPRRQLPPKFDLRLYRKGGHNWASEVTLESLKWWHTKALESVASGGEYAEKDQKKASNLERWIAWRSWEPEACWQGERNDKAVTARAPSKSPELHSQMPVERQPGEDHDGL